MTPATPRADDVPGLLFTAFEPSGDALSAPVIEALRQRLPNVPVWALGGPRMKAAGASLVETTTDRPVMLAGAAAEAWTHHRRLRRLGHWLARHSVGVHVPVDSPAANWSICRLVRRRAPRAKIVHLAAPQLWAWGAWRVGRLRRLTDHVLCLLPFEPEWFARRGVAASFVGHPLYDHDGNRAAPFVPLDPPPPEASSKLAMLPGSRPREIRANWPTMFETFRRLAARNRSVSAIAAVGDETSARLVTALSRDVRGGGDGGTEPVPALRVGQTDAVLSWCDLALVVSGTATLQAAAHRRPLVAIYKLHWISWHLAGRWIVRGRPLTLPNLIAQADGGERAITEFVPHLGGAEAVATALESLIRDPAARAGQAERLEAIASRFRGRRFAADAADRLQSFLHPGPGGASVAGSPPDNSPPCAGTP